MSLPYFPMFPTDFEADTSHLTLAEDGAYNRLLRIMWMTPGCSIPHDKNWIKRRMRVDQKQFDDVVAVVIEEFFKVKRGRVFSPRLSQEFDSANAAHEKRVSAGRKGGKISKSLKNNNSDPSKAQAKPKQPEPEPEPYNKKGTTYPKNGAKTEFELVGENISLEQMAFNLWNQLAEKHNLSKAQVLSESRIKSVKARMKEAGGISGWQAALEKVEQSDFLLGRKTDFRASFDFLLQKSSFISLMEGKYDNNPNGTGPRNGSALMDQFED